VGEIYYHAEDVGERFHAGKHFQETLTERLETTGYRMERLNHFHSIYYNKLKTI